jgi:5'-3' exonuclease
MRLHLVDGTYELFRAHFSKLPDHRTPDGREAKATLGLVRSLLALLTRDRDEAVTHLAVAFDNPIRSFRNDLYEGYKDDVGVPEDLRAQFDLAEDGVRALGVTVWSMDRYEADDALATAATRFVDAVAQVRILTPDKDLGQCLRGEQVVQVDRMRGKVIDESAFRERWGIEPASMPDLLGLVGDRADGIPGLAGIGEKTAALLLAEFGRIEAIPDDPQAWPKGIRGAKRHAATLAANREEALLYRRLATLVTDVPLAEDLAALRWAGVPEARMAAWSEGVGKRL